MAMASHVCIVCLLSVLTIIRVISAINYRVSYKAPDDTVERFKRKVGEDFAISTMKEAVKFVQEQVLDQSNELEERKYVDILELIVDEGLQACFSTYTRNEDHTDHYFILINAQFIAKSDSKRLKIRKERLIYAETARILQWAPDEDLLQEYIAYEVLLEKEIPPKPWVPVKEGDQWNSTVELAAQFLFFCNKRKRGFVAFLNDKMFRRRFRESFIEEFFGEKFDVLWKEYKEEYGVTSVHLRQ